MDKDPLKILHEPQNYFTQQKAGSSLERTMPKFPNTAYKYLFTSKGGCAIKIFCNGMDLGLLIQI